ncbi:MAG TPA: hypothetical protein VFR58_02765 [Flavisolibacter sp.]|nr:hypothetical protein [Flavisolibacter sp.]
MIKSLSAFALLLSLSMLLCACSREDTATDSNADYASGFGYSVEPPRGKVFTLPAGILLDSIRLDAVCETDNRVRTRDSGIGFFRVCITAVNRTSSPLELVLPAGLIFRSNDDRTQNGILLTPVKLLVDPKLPARFLLYGYCLNPNRKVTAHGDRYSLGPQTIHPQMLTLIKALEGKEEVVDVNGLSIRGSLHKNMEQLQKTVDLITTDGVMPASVLAAIKKF